MLSKNSIDNGDDMNNGSSPRSDAITKGKEVVKIEADALLLLIDRIDESFADAVDMIFKSKGRVIVTGMGKSGIIARKIVATFNSTGTPAFFLHPSDAVHGDLGMVRSEDIVILASKSGATAEIINLLPMLKRIGVKIISMVGNKDSIIAHQGDIVLDISVREEACPHDLAPTSSTTVTLALGDALAIALLERRNFTKEDFAQFHPGGFLGRKLLLKVSELMAKGEAVPIVQEGTSLSSAIVVMTSKRLGAASIVDASGKLTGIITDGDLRRLLQRQLDVSNVMVEQVMSRNPKTMRENMLAAAALEFMETYNITQLIIVDGASKPIGMLHLHDLVKLGL